MNVIAIIPARAGSTRLLAKNRKRIAGLTIVQHAVLTATVVPELNEIIVSSDSKEILSDADRITDDDRLTLHLRDPQMATETSPLEPLLSMLTADRPAATHVCLLNPTSPLRTSETIRNCIARCADYDTVATVYKSRLPDYRWQNVSGAWLPPFQCERPRSQDIRPSLIEHGACYVVARYVIECGFLFGARCFPVETDPIEAIDIDNELDLIIARSAYAYRHRIRGM